MVLENKKAVQRCNTNPWLQRWKNSTALSQFTPIFPLLSEHHDLVHFLLTLSFNYQQKFVINPCHLTVLRRPNFRGVRTIPLENWLKLHLKVAHQAELPRSEQPFGWRLHLHLYVCTHQPNDLKAGEASTVICSYLQLLLLSSSLSKWEGKENYVPCSPRGQKQ